MRGFSRTASRCDQEGGRARRAACRAPPAQQFFPHAAHCVPQPSLPPSPSLLPSPSPSPLSFAHLAVECRIRLHQTPEQLRRPPEGPQRAVRRRKGRRCRERLAVLLWQVQPHLRQPRGGGLAGGGPERPEEAREILPFARVARDEAGSGGRQERAAEARRRRPRLDGRPNARRNGRGNGGSSCNRSSHGNTSRCRSHRDRRGFSPG